MIDPKLEKQLADIKELLALWRKYHEFFVLGVKGTDIIADKEQRFLELKSKIAMLHDTFMDALSHDQAIGQHVLSLVERAITLRHLSRLSVAEVKKMEIEWHEAYLLLNETIGVLEERKAGLSHISASSYRARQISSSLAMNISSFLGSYYFRLIAVFIVFILVLWALPAFELFDYSRLKDFRYTRPLYKSARKFIRKAFKAEIPYDKISELVIDTSKRAENNVTQRTVPPDIDVNKVAMRYFQTDVYYHLRSPLDFRIEEYLYGKDPVQINYFLFKTITEADDVVKRFNEWKKSHQQDLPWLPTLAAATAFRKLNIVIFIITFNEKARQYFTNYEFGVLG